MANPLGSVDLSIVQKLSELPSVRDFGAKLDGLTDDTAAFMSALTAENVVTVPIGERASGPWTAVITSTLTLDSGQSLIGYRPAERWRGDIRRAKLAKIKYYGTGSCFQIVPSAGTDAAGVDTVVLRNLHVDGLDSGLLTDGLVLSVPAGSFIEGLRIDGCSFVNFPHHQISVSGNAFDLKFSHVTLHNRDQSAHNNLVHFYASGSFQGQVEWDKCFLAQYGNGYWCIYAETVGDMVLLGGTIAGYSDTVGGGSHGVYADGGLHIFGTHLEGYSASQLTTVGVQYTGANGAHISPSSCATWGVGIRIGNPAAKTTVAEAAVISGSVGNNNCFGATKTIIGATNASPIVVETSAAHGITTGDLVRVEEVTGNTAANGTVAHHYLWKTETVDATHVKLLGSTGNAAYAGGGTLRKITGADVLIVDGGPRYGVVLAGVGYSNGEPVIVDNRHWADGVHNEISRLIGGAVVAPSVRTFRGLAGVHDYAYSSAVFESADHNAVQTKIPVGKQAAWIVSTPGGIERAYLTWDDAAKTWKLFGPDSSLFHVVGRGFVVNTDAAQVALIVRGASGQTADLQNWQNNAGTNKAYIDEDGNAWLAGGLSLGTDLAVADGGTGASTLTSHGVLLGNGTGAVTATAEGATGKVLTGNTGAAPTWQDPVAVTVFTDRGDPAASDYTAATLTTDGAWHDLNLSSIVPAGATSVVLRISAASTSGSGNGYLRKNGNSNSVNATTVSVSTTAVHLDAVVACDANRVIEYFLPNLTYGLLTVTVAGWWK